MAKGVQPKIGQDWHSERVVTFNGQTDTHINTGEIYDTITLVDLFKMEPARKEKAAAPAFIPSTYHSYDARSHQRQREEGRFVALTGDIDSGGHTIDELEKLVAAFSGGAAYMIYSTAHAHALDMRWRVIIPTIDALPFDTWVDAQNSFFDYMEQHNVEMDRALDRAGQPVYMPNVPDIHPRTGEKLRDSDGDPLYYVVRSSLARNGINVGAGPCREGMNRIAAQRIEDEKRRERLREEAQRRAENRPQTDGAPIIQDFNQNNSIARLLEGYGYEQCPVNRDDWRSPNQTSGSYATRVMGDKWVSLSASDAGARIGENFKSGCFGDAYDLYVYYEHETTTRPHSARYTPKGDSR